MIAPPKPRRMRWWPALAIVALAVANLFRVWSSDELDSNFRNMQTILTVAVTIVLLLLWMLFFSRIHWRKRLVALGVVVIIGFCIAKTVRFDGSVNGTGLPKLVWKWTPQRDGLVKEFHETNPKVIREPLQAHPDYAGFLGPNRSGMLDNVELDRDWKSHPPKELWRREIGLGWGSFAIAGTNAITQEQRGDWEMTICYDLATGQTNWASKNQARFSETMGGDGPRATPTIVDGKVYALGGTGLLECLDAETGTRVWCSDTLASNGLPNTFFGKSSSPLVFDDLVVVTGGMTNECTLLAFHRSDGSQAWHAGSDMAGYASPALVTLAGKRQILSLNAASLSGHDPADGKVLWKYDWGSGKWPLCTQPVLLPNDKIFISGSFGLGCVMLQVMSSADGKLGITELWKNRNMKSEYSTLVVRSNFLYGLDDGILACMDLTTGDRKWKDGRYGHGQLLLASDTIIVQTEPGAIALVEATPDGLRELGKVDGLKAKTWNTPALAGQYLIIRNDREAVCYQLPLKQKELVNDGPRD